MSVPENSTSGTSDLQFTFVVKEAKKYFNLVDVILVLEEGRVRVHHLLPVQEDSFSKRIAFAFISWKFNTTETNDFLAALANSAGIAPDANNYFRHYHEGLVIETCGLSFECCQVPEFIQDVIQTFSDVKPLDADNFRHLKQTWFDMLRVACAMKLS